MEALMTSLGTNCLKNNVTVIKKSPKIGFIFFVQNIILFENHEMFTQKLK